jgi:hypothetical protein
MLKYFSHHKLLTLSKCVERETNQFVHRYLQQNKTLSYLSYYNSFCIKNILQMRHFVVYVYTCSLTIKMERMTKFLVSTVFYVKFN